MNRFYILLLPLALLLTTCGNDTATNSTGGGAAYVLQYPDEAYAMALVEARTLRAPQELVEQIDRELVMIRDQWRDSIPEIDSAIFWAPWMSLSLELIVDTTVFNFEDTSACRILDSVAAANDAHITRPHPQWWPGLFAVPSVPWYPAAAAELFAGLPGVRGVYCQPTFIADVFRSNLRTEEPGGARWIIVYQCDGGLELSFFQFRIAGRRARLVDVVQPCLDFQSLLEEFGPSGAWEIVQQYADSVNHNRPAWADSALVDLDRLLLCHMGDWTVNGNADCQE